MTSTGLLTRTDTEELAGMTIRTAIEIDNGVVLVFDDNSFAVIEGEGDEDASAGIRSHAIDIQKVLSTKQLLDAFLINAAQAELIDKQNGELKLAALKGRADRAQKEYEREVDVAKSRLARQLAHIKQSA